MNARTVVFRTIATCLLFLGGMAYAEEIQHHGVPVEAEATFAQCVSCHDGTTAHNVAFCIAKCSAVTPHPVLKNYPPRGRESAFAPAAMVKAKGIRLADGKVTCISCHNLRDPRKNHLVMDNRGSRLCLTCHINK